jgi:hypothetical protein
MRFTLATLGALACAAPVLGEKLVGALGHPYDPNYQRGSISGFELVRSERVVKNGGDVLASAGTAGAATPLVTERATYRSPGMRLAPGEVVFTDPNNTPLKMPAGKVGILSFDAQVVDRNGTPVLLSEVYLHHWLIFDGFGNSGVCGGYLGYKFGVGAESRNTKTAFPEGYALKTTGTERWGANIHMLRTDDVPDVKSCIECHCASGGGNFACCPDGSYCDTKPGIDRAQREYFLEYTVEYIPDPAEHTAVEIFVLDASNCEIEYNVPQCEGPPCVADRSYKATLANDMDLVLALGHLHIGGINVTFLAETPEGKTIDICTSYPTYGTGDKAGDENGYLVAMSPCQSVHVHPIVCFYFIYFEGFYLCVCLGMFLFALFVVEVEERSVLRISFFFF